MKGNLLDDGRVHIPLGDIAVSLEKTYRSMPEGYLTKDCPGPCEIHHIKQWGRIGNMEAGRTCRRGCP